MRKLAVVLLLLAGCNQSPSYTDLQTRRAELYDVRDGLEYKIEHLEKWDTLEPEKQEELAFALEGQTPAAALARYKDSLAITNAKIDSVVGQLLERAKRAK